MELERYRDRVRSLGLNDVAQDVGTLLEKHRNNLPPHLPGAVETFPSDKLTFVYKQQNLPITQVVLEDPEYTTSLMKPVLELGLLEGRYSTGLMTRTWSGLMLGVAYDSALSRYRSMAEIMAIPDDELSHIRGLGKKSLSLFRYAIQMLRERLIENQVEPGAH